MAQVQDAIDVILDQIRTKEGEISQLKKAANLLAVSTGTQPPFDAVDSEDATPQATGGALRVKADQFAAETTPASAARAFLTLSGKERGSRTFDEIFDALTRGGFERWKGESKNSLRIAMGKDRAIRRLKNGTYGLWGWYGGRPTDEDDEERVSLPNGSAKEPKDDDEK